MSLHYINKRLFATTTAATTTAQSTPDTPLLNKRYKSKQSTTQRQFRRYGIPFLAFMLLGSFGMSKMISGKFELENERNNDARLQQELNHENAVDIAQKSLLKPKQRKNNIAELNSELAKLQSELEWNADYDIVRVPRQQTAEEAQAQYREKVKAAQAKKRGPRVTPVD